MKKILFLLSFFLLFTSSYAADLSLSSYSSTPSVLSPGQTFKLTITIQNDGVVNAENVKVILDNKFPFSTLQTEQTTSIQTTKKSTLEFDVKVSPLVSDGTYTMDIKYGSGAMKKEALTFTISSETPNIEIVSTNTTSISPSEKKELVLTLKNTGNSTARNIVIKFDNDYSITTTGVIVKRNLTTLGPSSKTIEILEPGQEKEVSFIISADPNSDLKAYLLPFTVSYYTLSNSSLSNTSYIGLEITGQAQLDSTIEHNGTSITISVFNTGFAEAKFVVAELESDLKLEQEKVFIGSLEADDFDSFKVYFTPTTGEKTVKVRFSYLNKDAEKVFEEKEFKINIYPESGGFSLPILELFALIGLVWTGKFLYKRFIKKKNE